MQPQDWFDETFDADYLAIYAATRDPQRAEREAWEIARALDLRAGNAVLDCPCGFGRHALVLAKAGYLVTGVDRSKPFLEHARAEAAKNNLKAEFVEADIRALPAELSGRFDAAYSAFTSFGFFDSDAENEQTLRELARALKPGGRVLVELVNHLWVLTHFRAKSWFRGENCLVLEDVSYDWKCDQIVNKREVRFDDGRARSLPAFRVRAYRPADLLRMAEAAGLKVNDFAGGYDGRAFEALESPRMVLLAEKAK
ncbi:MAG: methyltransferase domain-containing protein [Planctomycetes bacterium]|nr:methyltransferase domain-containing protein [Planctomycetota bacterium]